MLRFFRINDPYRLIFIFLILIGVRFIQSYFIDGQFLLELKWLLLGEWLGKGFQMYREAYDYTGPLAAMIYKYLDQLFGRSLFTHHLFSSLIIIFQAAMFNGILLKNKAFDENNYLPALFYVVGMLSVPDFMSLSPQLMSMTFILAALGKVLRRIDNQATDELFLNSGIYIGVATMIYLPSIVFFLVFLGALIVFSSAIPRRLLLYVFGFLLIFGVCSVYFLWRGDFNYFFQSIVVHALLLDAEILLNTRELALISSVFIGVFVLTVFKAISSSRLTNFQQRAQQVIWFMFIGGLLCFFLTNKKTGLELIFLVPLLAYFMSHYFMLIKNRLLKAVMPAVVIFGLLGFNLYVYQTMLGAVIVSEIEVEEDNILVLDERFGYYLSKESGSPCFSVPICEAAFEGLDYYQAATHIHNWLNKADPEVIIDEIGALPKLFYRFPLLESEYKKVGPKTWKKVSN